MDRKKRREQTHRAYMQIEDTTERVIGARGQCTTRESVIPEGRYRERARGWGRELEKNKTIKE